MINLDGKTAVICGASSGIGAATADVMAKAGANLVLVARRKEALEKVASTCERSSMHKIYACDLAKDDEVDSLCIALRSEPKIDILVNNTGGPAPNPPANTTVEEVRQALQSHLFAAMKLSQAVIPIMKKGGYGRIIQIVSVTARVPLVHLTASNIARGAVLAWAKTLSESVAKDGITVNNILPGYTRTDRVSQLLRDTSAKNGISEAEAEARIVAEIPFGRLASAEEVASAVVFFASNAASYITGTSLTVDGGFVRTI